MLALRLLHVAHCFTRNRLTFVAFRTVESLLRFVVLLKINRLESLSFAASKLREIVKQHVKNLKGPGKKRTRLEFRL